jgi:hypothetical protein
MALRILCLLLACGCVNSGPNSLPKILVVPDEMRRVPAAKPPAPPPTAPAAKTAASLASTVTPVSREMRPAAPDSSRRYLVRVTEHGRTWELDLPESRGGYELRIPIEPSAGETPSAADAELLAGGPAPQKGYLANLARIAEMYAAHKFEMALIELVDLEVAFPRDGRIQAMKGSLYQKLGKAKLARDAWQKALALDPQDTGVAEALRELQGKEE